MKTEEQDKINLETIARFAENYKMSYTAVDRNSTDDYVIMYGCGVGWSNKETDRYLNKYLKLRETDD